MFNSARENKSWMKMFQQQGLYLLNYYVYFAQYAYIKCAYMTYCIIFTVYAVFKYQFTKNEKASLAQQWILCSEWVPSE